MNPIDNCTDTNRCANPGCPRCGFGSPTHKGAPVLPPGWVAVPREVVRLARGCAMRLMDAHAIDGSTTDMDVNHATALLSRLQEVPETPLPEHFMNCNTCGLPFDMRDLDQVIAHEHQELREATGIRGRPADASASVGASLPVLNTDVISGCRHENIEPQPETPDGYQDGTCADCGETGFPIKDPGYEEFLAEWEAGKPKPQAVRVPDAEGTAFPWWGIVDPDGMAHHTDDCAESGWPSRSKVAHCITGPFFSREAAERYLDVKSYNFGERAGVWCFSGHSSQDWRKLCKEDVPLPAPAAEVVGEVSDE